MDSITPASPSTSVWIPTPTDDPAYERKGETNSDGLKKYYFSFLAIAAVIAGIVAVLLVRRARLRAQRALQHEREVDLWNFRTSHSAGASPDHVREEGLDEHGEAPPPYETRQLGETSRVVNDEEMGSQTTRSEPAVPSRTLSRHEAGLKPPEYTEVNVRSV